MFDIAFWKNRDINFLGDKERLNRFLDEDFDGLDLHELLQDLENLADQHEFIWHGKTISVETYGFTFDYFSISGEPSDFVLNRTCSCINGIRRSSHNLLTIPESKQKLGIGKEIIGIFYKQYKKANFKFIDIEAGKLRGGYVWAKYGFAAINPVQVYQILNQATMRGIPEEAITVFRTIAEAFYAQNSGLAFPIYIWATLPYGETLLTGSHWSGILDLDNPEQIAIFEIYLKTTAKG